MQQKQDDFEEKRIGVPGAHKICVFCKTDIPEDSNFCPQCHLATKCLSCGKSISSISMTCPYCGKETEAYRIACLGTDDLQIKIDVMRDLVVLFGGQETILLHRRFGETFFIIAGVACILLGAAVPVCVTLRTSLTIVQGLMVGAISVGLMLLGLWNIHIPFSWDMLHGQLFNHDDYKMLKIYKKQHNIFAISFEKHLFRGAVIATDAGKERYNRMKNSKELEQFFKKQY